MNVKQYDHHLDDILSIDSSSSYIVDVTEEVKFDTFSRDQ